MTGVKHTEGRACNVKPDLKQAVILLASVSVLALISGCGISNPFGDHRPDQVVEGERHTPVYNTWDEQQIAQMRAAAKAQQVAAAGPPAAVPGRQDSFDYYGAAQPAPQGAALGSLNPAPVRGDMSLLARKPLAQNIYGAQHASAPQSAPASSYQTSPAPASVEWTPPRSASQTASRNAPATAYAPADNTAAPADASVTPAAVSDTPAQTAAAASSPSFFDRVMGRSDSNANTDNLPPPWKTRGDFELPESEKNAPFTPFSSVPAAPSEFKDIKATHEQDVQSLQDEHAAALVQKQALDAEPSQQLKVTPVEMPPAHTAPAAPPPSTEPPVQATAPVAAPPPAATAESSPAYASSPDNGPREPKRGVDIMTQKQWDAMQKARQQHLSQPPESSQPMESTGMMPSPQNSSPAMMSPEISSPAPSSSPTDSPESSMGAPSSSAPLTQPPVMPTPAASSPDDKAGSGSPPETVTPPASKPLSENQPAPKAEETAAAAVPAEPNMEVAEQRPSFFGRLFTPSPEADGARNTAAAEVDPAPKETKQASGGWLQLIPDAQAHPVENTEPVRESQVEAGTLANDNSAAPAQLIGEISDKTAASTQSNAAPSVLDTPAASQGAPARKPSYGTRLFNTKAPMAEPAIAEAAPAQENTTPSVTTSETSAPSHPSFFGRLFHPEPKPATDETVQESNAATNDHAKAAAAAADTSVPAATLLPDTSTLSPSVAAPSAAAASVASGDSSASLPSPELLKQMKMMPVSRYSIRQNQDSN